MRPKVTIIYNEPAASRYHDLGEERALLGVLDEVEGVYNALTERGYSVSKLPLSPPLSSVREKLERLETEVVFNLFEGFEGSPATEAAVAGMLEELGLAHTGCPSSALLLALDKGKAKVVMERAGIATPRYQLLTKETIGEFNLGFPCIIKPVVEDASHGITDQSVVYDPAGLRRQLGHVCDSYGGNALVEEFLEGREFNISVLGVSELSVLPISEIAYALPAGMPRLLTFAAKWDDESVDSIGTAVTCPAQIDQELRERIEQIAKSVYRLLGCSGYARADLRLDNDGNPMVLEVNPNPDLSPGVGAARQAAAAGMSYADLIEQILGLAREGTKLPLNA